VQNTCLSQSPILKIWVIILVSLALENSITSVTTITRSCFATTQRTNLHRTSRVRRGNSARLDAARVKRYRPPSPIQRTPGHAPQWRMAAQNLVTPTTIRGLFAPENHLARHSGYIDPMAQHALVGFASGHFRTRDGKLGAEFDGQCPESTRVVEHYRARILPHL